MTIFVLFSDDLDHHLLTVTINLQLLVLVIESGKEQTAVAMSNLLKAFYDACYITTDQMTQGFVRVLDNLTDIQLDAPQAFNSFDNFADICFKQGFLPNRVLKELPGRSVCLSANAVESIDDGFCRFYLSTFVLEYFG